MDAIDRDILRILKDEGRATCRSIGKRVALSEGAVRKRIKNLLNSGKIRRFTIKRGDTEGAEAITLLSITPYLSTSEISQLIKKLPNVDAVHEITGEYDIAVVITGSSITEVNESIETVRQIEGVNKTNTMIILRSW